MRRIARSFLLMLLFATAAVPGVAGDEVHVPDLDRGKVLTQARCLACHQENSISFLVDHCTSERGADYLDTFLEGHHAPDAEARADIIAYLTCDMELPPQE